jgi:hypothetical protein
MQSQSTLSDLSAHIFADSVRDRWGNTVLPANETSAPHASSVCQCALSRLRHSSNCLLAATSIWADTKEYERMQIDAAPFLHPVVESSGSHKFDCSCRSNVVSILSLLSRSAYVWKCPTSDYFRSITRPLTWASFIRSRHFASTDFFLQTYNVRLFFCIQVILFLVQDIQHRQSRASLEQRYLRIDAELDTAFHQYFRCISLLHLAPTESPTYFILALTLHECFNSILDFFFFFSCRSLSQQAASNNQSKPISASESNGSGSVTVDSYTRWTPSWAASILPAQPASLALSSTSSSESALNTSSTVCSCKRPISVSVPFPSPLHSADIQYDAKLFGELDWNFLISAPMAVVTPLTVPPDTSSTTSKTTSNSSSKSASHSTLKQPQPAAQAAVPAAGTSNVTVATHHISALGTPELPSELKSWLHVRGRLLYCIQSASQLFSLRSPCATRLALRLLLRLLTDGPLMVDARRSSQHSQLRQYFTNRHACYDHVRF